MASEPLKASNSPCFTQWAAYQSRKSPTDSAEEAFVFAFKNLKETELQNKKHAVL